MKKQVIMLLEEEEFMLSAAAYLQIMKKDKQLQERRNLSGWKAGCSAERFMGSMRSLWQNSEVKTHRASEITLFHEVQAYNEYRSE